MQFACISLSTYLRMGNDFVSNLRDLRLRNSHSSFSALQLGQVWIGSWITRWLKMAPFTRGWSLREGSVELLTWMRAVFPWVGISWQVRFQDHPHNVLSRSLIDYYGDGSIIGEISVSSESCASRYWNFVYPVMKIIRFSKRIFTLLILKPRIAFGSCGQSFLFLQRWQEVPSYFRVVATNARARIHVVKRKTMRKWDKVKSSRVM